MALRDSGMARVHPQPDDAAGRREARRPTLVRRHLGRPCDERIAGTSQPKGAGHGLHTLGLAPELRRPGGLGIGVRVIGGVKVLRPSGPDVRLGQPGPWLGLKVGLASYSFSKPPLTLPSRASGGLESTTSRSRMPTCRLKSTRTRPGRGHRSSATPGSRPELRRDRADRRRIPIRSAFEYARDAGIPTIVCNPTRQSLPVLDKLVKEFDIRLAIHNHGPEDKVWPSPLDVGRPSKNMTTDRRVHRRRPYGAMRRRPGRGPAQRAARLYDIHLKDLENTGPKARGSRSAGASSTSARC